MVYFIFRKKIYQLEKHCLFVRVVKMQNIQLWSDFSAFNLHLFPFIKSGSYGLNDEKGVFLFLLDIDKKIKERAYHAYLSLFWQGDNGDVYVLSPTKTNAYLNSSEILHRLGISVISPPPTKTVEQLQHEFKHLLKDEYFTFLKYLTDAKPLLRNTNGDMVYDSFLGRYVYATQMRSKKGKADGDFLYAVNADGDIDKQALVECAKAYLLDFSQRYDNIDDFKKIVFRCPTKDVVVAESLDLSNKIIDTLTNPKDVTPLQSISFDNALRQAEASIVYDLIHRKEKTLALFKEAFYDTLNLQRNTVVKQVKKNNLPHLNMPMSLTLSYLLSCNSDNRIYSDSVGNLTMLSALGDIDTLVLYNSLKNDISLFSQYHNQTIDIYDSSFTRSFKYSFSIYPKGFNHIEVILPITNPDGKLIVSRTIDNLALSRIITMLQKREQDGRSLFLIPCTDFGELGEHFEFFAWLQSYYQDVGVFDLSSELFFNDIDPTDMRIVIVGSEKSPRPKNLTEYNHRIKDITESSPTRTIHNYDQLFELCQEVVTRELSKPYLTKHYPNVDTDINVNIFHQISLKLKEVHDIENPLISKHKPENEVQNTLVIKGAFIDLTRQSFAEQSGLKTDELIATPHLNDNDIPQSSPNEHEANSSDDKNDENNSTDTHNEIEGINSLGKEGDDTINSTDNITKIQDKSVDDENSSSDNDPSVEPKVDLGKHDDKNSSDDNNNENTSTSDDDDGNNSAKQDEGDEGDEGEYGNYDDDDSDDGIPAHLRESESDIDEPKTDEPDFADLDDDLEIDRKELDFD